MKELFEKYAAYHLWANKMLLEKSVSNWQTVLQLINCNLPAKPVHGNKKNSFS